MQNDYLQNFAKFQNFQLDNLVDFAKCWKTRIDLQRSVPIQPKTSDILPSAGRATGRRSRARRGSRGPRGWTFACFKRLLLYMRWNVFLRARHVRKNDLHVRHAQIGKHLCKSLRIFAKFKYCFMKNNIHMAAFIQNMCLNVFLIRKITERGPILGAFAVWAVQKYAHIVYLVKNCPTRI